MNSATGGALVSVSVPPPISVPQLNGIYFITGLAAAESADRNLTLVLSQDGTAALMTEFVGRGTMIERGTWMASDRRVVINWTEMDGEAIHLRMIFELRGKGLTCVGPDPNALGAKGITLYRAMPAI